MARKEQVEQEEDPLAGSRMTLGEHLEELRKRILRALLAVGIAFCIGWFFQEPFSDVVLRPYRQAVAMLNEYWVAESEALLEANPSEARSTYFTSDEPGNQVLRGMLDTRLLMTGPGEGFFFVVKIALYFALFAGSPFVLWQVWQFIGAGLYRDERRSIVRYFPASLLLFLVGVLFGYFGMVPYAMYYLGRSVPLELARPDIRLEEYFAFLSSLSLALGAVFQLPIVMLFTVRLGIVEVATLARYRGHFVLLAFVVAAILTPPDPVTQLLMAVPMVALFELGLLLARIGGVRRKVKPAA